MKSTRKCRILLVDDEPLYQDFVGQLLDHGGGYEVMAVSSGEEALAALTDFQPDIVLLDIGMTGMDGYSVCRAIRADDACRLTKIIMVSGRAAIDERLRGYEAGADDYITKPFDKQEFLAKIKVYSKLKHQEEVDQVKSDLLTLLTHETITPINGILGCSELLLADSDLTEKQRELVDLMAAAGEQLSNFLHNAILLCKLKAGLGLTLSLEPVFALAESVAGECAGRYRDKDIRWTVSGDRDLQFEADWPLLRCALQSIVCNAMKFSPAGSAVAIQVFRHQAAAEIIVDDLGCGLDHQRKAGIFEEFSINDLAHHTCGQGLSMAISQRICVCHGGDISVQDNPGGRGCRFIMTIPLQVTGDICRKNTYRS